MKYTIGIKLTSKWNVIPHKIQYFTAGNTYEIEDINHVGLIAFKDDTGDIQYLSTVAVEYIFYDINTAYDDAMSIV